MDAYQQRMWEIELERISEGSYGTIERPVDNRWDQSIRIVKAAKRQLLGH